MDVITYFLGLLLLSLSFPAGFLVAKYTRSELREIAREARIEKIVGVKMVIIEAAVMSALLYAGTFVFTGAAIILVANVALYELYNSLKQNLAISAKHEALFLILSAIGFLIVLLV